MGEWVKFFDGTTTISIEPGGPQENGYAESFNSCLQGAHFGREEFENAPEARAYGMQHR